MAAELGEERFAARTGLPCLRAVHAGQVRLDARPRAGRGARRALAQRRPSGSCAASAARRRRSCSLASRTGFYDLHERRPWDDALAWAGAPDGLMPEAVDAGTPMGRASARRLGRAAGAVLDRRRPRPPRRRGRRRRRRRGRRARLVRHRGGVRPRRSRRSRPTRSPRTVAAGVTVGWHAVPGRQALLGAVWSGSALPRVLALLGVPVEERHELEAPRSTPTRHARAARRRRRRR